MEENMVWDKSKDQLASEFGYTQDELDDARADQDPVAPGVQLQRTDVTAGSEFASIKDKIAAKRAEAEAKQAAWGKQKKKAFDRGPLEESFEDMIRRVSKKEAITSTAGVGGDTLIEARPKYIKTKSERVFATTNNSYMVLGRDRPGNKKSGYGGKGYTGCGSIDLVVGRKVFGKKKFVDPNFDTDAARIHISQRTDIDENFTLWPGPGTPNSEARSSIGIKADTIRVVARENIRLVTLGPEKQNSQGGALVSTGGIDLMAGNLDEDMQPLVKGDNLREALEELIELMEVLSGAVSGLTQFQITHNAAMANHFHHSAFFGLPTTPPTCQPVISNTLMNLFSKTKLDMVKYKLRLIEYKFKYLLPVNEEKFINSKYNNTN